MRWQFCQESLPLFSLSFFHSLSSLSLISIQKKHEYIWKESETRLEKETHRETEKLKKLHRLQKLVKNKFKICHHHFSLLFVREMNLPEKERERINREELPFLDQTASLFSCLSRSSLWSHFFSQGMKLRAV